MDFASAVRMEQLVLSVQRRWRGHRARREHHGFVLRAGDAKAKMARMAEMADDFDAGRELQGRELQAPRAAALGGAPPSSPPKPRLRRRTLSEEQARQLRKVASWKSRSRALSKLSKLTRGSSRCSHPMLMMPALWIEATDKKHRYGGNLKHYHERWLEADTLEDFFHWLDHGEGARVDLAPEVPRSELERNRVKYCTPRSLETCLRPATRAPMGPFARTHRGDDRMA